MMTETMSEIRGIPLQRPSWLSESVWPFETFGLAVDDSVLAVTDVGHGPTLLFVHTGMWSFLWRDVITRLAADFRCVCFDAPGTGRTYSNSGSAVTLSQAARSTTAVIEQLGLDNITLIMHDLGALAALAGVSRIPHRISAIVAMNTFAWKPAGRGFRGMLALMGSKPMREIDVLTGCLPRITVSDFGIGRHLDAASRKAFLAGLGTQGRRAFHNYMCDARRCDDIYACIGELLTKPFTDLPLLTIFGEMNDPFGFQETWKTLFHNTRQVVVSKGHHFPMCDAPSLVAEEIQAWHPYNLERRLA